MGAALWERPDLEVREVEPVQSFRAAASPSVDSITLGRRSLLGFSLKYINIVQIDNARGVPAVL